MMSRVSPFFALFFVMALATPAAAQSDRDQDRDPGPRETETVERTLSLASGGTVRLKTFSGRVNITGGSGNQVVVKAVRRASRQRLDEIKLEITHARGDITFDSFSGRFDSDLAVTPRRAAGATSATHSTVAATPTCDSRHSAET